MNSVIITGAHGFIGSSLTNYFLKKGYKVIGIDPNYDLFNRIDKKDNYFHFKNLEECQACVTNVEVFYHLGWGLSTYKNGEGLDGCLAELENIKKSCQVADFAIKICCKKFVFVGSNYQEMYAIDNEKIISNKARCNIYGIAKSTASDMCRKLMMDAKIQYNNVLLANTFGVGDFSNKAVNFFIEELLSNRALNLIEGNKSTDWVYIDDTTLGLYTVGIEGKNLQEYYIGHKELKTFKELICLLKETLNSSSTLEFGKYRDKDFIDYSRIDVSRIYIDTAFEMTDDLANQFLNTSNWIYKRKNKKV